ncbi:MAG: DUF6465 family protein [Clostridiales bacterium]|nr:DUF6465 family protein [Clostridiales bacterium]
MATEKTNEPVDTTIIEEEVVDAQDKKAAAKEANAKVREAMKEAAKKNAKAAGAVAKDTAEMTKKVTKKAAKATKATTEKAAKATKATAEKAAKATKATAEKAAKATKATAEKATRKYTKKPVKASVLQYLGSEISEDELYDRAMAQFAATEGAVPVKKITLYIKPEELAAYYVINDEYTGKVDF